MNCSVFWEIRSEKARMSWLAMPVEQCPLAHSYTVHSGFVSRRIVLRLWVPLLVFTYRCGSMSVNIHCTIHGKERFNCLGSWCSCYSVLSQRHPCWREAINTFPDSWYTFRLLFRRSITSASGLSADHEFSHFFSWSFRLRFHWRCMPRRPEMP